MHQHALLDGIKGLRVVGQESRSQLHDLGLETQRLEVGLRPRAQDRRDDRAEIGCAIGAQRRPELLVFSLGQLGPPVHDHHVIAWQVGQVLAEVLLDGLDNLLLFESHGRLELVEAGVEKPNRQGNLPAGLTTLRVHLEVLEVAPAIDDEEAVLFGAPRFELALVGIEHPCATPDHLPELDV